MPDAAQRVDPAAYEPREGDEVEVSVRVVIAANGSAQYADIDPYLFRRMRQEVFTKAVTEGRVTLVHRPPVLPDEPPNLAVCRGLGNELWHRLDVPEDEKSAWWLDGEVYSYEQALKAGLDPSRRLVELPDPDDEAEMRDFARDVIRVVVGDVSVHVLYAAVRALSEEEAPDA